MKLIHAVIFLFTTTFVQGRTNSFDSIVNVFFNECHDTIFVIKKNLDTFYSQKNSYILSKCFYGRQNVMNEKCDCLQPTTFKKYDLISDSLLNMGYQEGENASLDIQISDKLTIIRKTKFDSLLTNYTFEYVEYRLFMGDTLISYPYEVEDILLDKTEDPKNELKKMIYNSTSLWKSKIKNRYYIEGVSQFVTIENGSEICTQRFENKIKIK